MDSLPPPSPSINKLQLLFANFGLNNNGRVELESKGASASLRINPPPGFGADPITQKDQELPSFSTNQVSGSGIPNPKPLYPKSIWRDLESAPASDLNPYYTSSVPFSSLNYMNWQQYNYVMEQATTSDGSHYLQSLLSRGDQRIVDQIFNGVIGSLLSLMTHEHGHYVFWKLIPLLGQAQVEKISQMLSQQDGKPIIDASFNSNGSHSLQRLMKPLVRWDMAGPLAAALADEFCRLMKDPTARAVVLKFVEIVPPEQSETLYRAGIESWLELATDATGCVSLNNFIEHVKGPLRKELLEKISDHSVFLAQDPTANHVLQKVVKLQDPIITEKICRLLKGEYRNLAVQKAGSYVVEKCLELTSSENWAYAVDDLVETDNDQLVHIAKNQYGNYVVQKALRVSKYKSPEDRHRKLLQKLESNLLPLRSGYGKNVLLEIARLKSLDDRYKSC